MYSLVVIERSVPGAVSIAFCCCHWRRCEGSMAVIYISTGMPTLPTFMKTITYGYIRTATRSIQLTDSDI